MANAITKASNAIRRIDTRLSPEAWRKGEIVGDAGEEFYLVKWDDGSTSHLHWDHVISEVQARNMEAGAA